MTSARTADPDSLTISSTDCRASAKRSPPMPTTMVGRIDSVSGTWMMIVSPWRGRFCSRMRPPICSMFARTTSMPTPRPEMAVTVSRLDNPASNTSSTFCASSIAAICAWVYSPRFTALAHTATDVDPAPVVGDLDHDLVARLPRGDRQPPGIALARGPAVGGCLQPVVDRVADDVDQRIAHHLDHLAVQLDIRAVDLQRDRLAQFARGIAHHPRQRGEQRLDLLHAGAGDGVAHLGDGQRQAFQRGLHARIDHFVAQPARQFVARQHHVGHAAHHPVEQIDVQADAARRRARDQVRDRRGGGGRILRQRGDQQVLGRIVQRHARVDRLDDLADAVDDRQHRADQRGVGDAQAVAHRGQHVLRGMAEAQQARQIEKAAAALHGVDEAEDRIEPRAVRRHRLPRHDLARQRRKRLAGFGDEFLKQIVHGFPSVCGRERFASHGVKGAFTRLGCPR